VPQSTGLGGRIPIPVTFTGASVAFPMSASDSAPFSATGPRVGVPAVIDPTSAAAIDPAVCAAPTRVGTDVPCTAASAVAVPNVAAAAAAVPAIESALAPARDIHAVLATFVSAAHPLRIATGAGLLGDT